jgi:hypothetical protein
MLPSTRLNIVDFFALTTCSHIHTDAVLTCRHAVHVEKNASATTKQTLKNVAVAKSNRPESQSCGILKVVIPT